MEGLFYSYKDMHLLIRKAVKYIHNML